jgi:transposase
LGIKRSYSTDLSDAQWGCLELHVPPPNKRERPETHSTREILDAIFYVSNSGCPWWRLPRDFPTRGTVYWWFRRWRIDGTFERLNAAEKAAKIWAEEWAKEGKKIDWERLVPQRGFRVLPRRWVVERTFSWLS